MIGKIQTPGWHLEGRLEEGGRWTVPIDQYTFIIGRDEQCHLKLLPDYISRKHAEIRTRGTELYIKDLKSKNGTFVNERRICEEVKLEDKDDIRFGDLKFRVLMNDRKSVRRLSETSLLKIPLKVKSFMNHYDISRREEQVLSYILQGKSTKKIADILCISEGTAKNHILSIYKKTDTHSRFELFTLFNNFSV
ncbi:MAG: FHA domain-containing protein [Spirochaetales bacterium]|nr:FHA domain-containing protein [Spirochaetales bacterium]